MANHDLGPSYKDQKPEITKHLFSLEDGAMERWRKGDPWGWIEISSEDVTYFDPTLEAPIVGLEALKAYYANIEGKITYEGSEYLQPQVQVYGDTAVLSYRYLSTNIGENGTPAHRTRWNCTEVYAKIDNKWKIVHTHWSYNGGREPIEG